MAATNRLPTGLRLAVAMSDLLLKSDDVRQRFTVTGVVQGVGFRPFVHRIASELGLAGFVGNDSGAVFLEVQGPATRVSEFGRRLYAEAPPLARISGVSVVDIDTNTADAAGFRIAESQPAAAATTAIPPDIALCEDCLAELFNPDDRRYRHPFVTCTNCGPRLTIIKALPYDRPATTMAAFAMCDRCADEYRDPGNRRFHAQPIACPDCGPSLWFASTAGRVTGSDAALAATQQALAGGAVVAVKSIGGYHLASVVDDDAVVRGLRVRKQRGDKPFALLVRDLDVARRYARIDDTEAAIMRSPARPIVLLRRRRDAPVADAVAPGSPLLGLMLPYSPVHHLLLAPVPGSHAPVPDALVLTSANRSDQPICFTEDDAAQRLLRPTAALCDAMLDHNRPIQVPCDDSVVRVFDGRELPIRRSRGYAPLPVDLGRIGPAVLAVGGELKNTFCLTDGPRAFMSGHIGDMGNYQTLRAFERAVSQLSEMRHPPARLVADLHPGYQTRSWAERHAGDRPLDLVQHHHAHVVSLLAEHGRLGEPITGVSFDGTGYGCDGSIWGGEILALGRDSHRFTRVANLMPMPLTGGDVAVRNPLRLALSQLWMAGIAWTPELPPVAAAASAELRVTLSQLQSGVCCVPCSSMGRLFDAVASLLGIRQRIDYEAQAAIELEVLAESAGGSAAPPLRLDVGAAGEIDPRGMIRAIVSSWRAGVEPALLAAAFHEAIAVAVAEAVGLVAGAVRLVGLTGGVFQNVLLLEMCRDRLTQAGFEVLTHHTVPPNDGGLALGQAAISILSALDSDPRAQEG